MLIEVKPGSVFASLTNMVSPLRKKSTLAIAFAAEKPKHLDRKLAETDSLLWRNIGGNTQIRTVGIDVFRLIGIEPVPARRHDLAELRRKDLAFCVLQDRTLDLPHFCHALLDKQFVVVAQCAHARRRKLCF